MIKAAKPATDFDVPARHDAGHDGKARNQAKVVGGLGQGEGGAQRQRLEGQLWISEAFEMRGILQIKIVQARIEGQVRDFAKVAGQSRLSRLTRSQQGDHLRDAKLGLDFGDEGLPLHVETVS